ncbi:ATP synthase F0 sector subunit b [hydrothermal vent metagenome]|uniref:ATP synthase F0 sector subunit b n=1 Tax=hydrothermal vent metagenome TaxID=652676 RepID=A0A1W1CZD3_9ZZZZ
MNIKNIALISAMVAVPSLVLASGGEHHSVTMLESDFKYRILNFAIFAGLVYYLVANPIKAFFVGRREDIANQLAEIEEKLKASKNERVLAEENLVKASKKAEELIVDAGKEAKLLSSAIAEKNENSLTLLEKHAKEKQEVEVKKATKATIDAILNSGFDNSDINVDEAKVVSLISKKVA